MLAFIGARLGPCEPPQIRAPGCSGAERNRQGYIGRVDPALGENNAGGTVAHDGNTVVELGLQIEVEVDVDDPHRDPGPARCRFEQTPGVVAQGAPLAGEEVEHGHRPTIVGFSMRPFTTLVVVGLLVLIVVAFVVKLQSTGLTP